MHCTKCGKEFLGLLLMVLTSSGVHDHASWCSKNQGQHVFEERTTKVVEREPA